MTNAAPHLPIVTAAYTVGTLAVMAHGGPANVVSLTGTSMTHWLIMARRAADTVR